jgi:hypothetical protein
MEMTTWFSGSGRCEDRSKEYTFIHTIIRFKDDMCIEGDNIDLIYDKLPDYNDSTRNNHIHPDSYLYRPNVDKYTYRVSNDLNDLAKHKKDVSVIIDTFFDLYKDFNINK